MFLVGMFACGFAYAQDKKAANSQQSKMSERNKEAGEKKGDDRKKFMSSCLKKDKPMTQQEKDQLFGQFELWQRGQIR
jgi:Ni/Co efflux regulator RcnB